MSNELNNLLKKAYCQWKNDPKNSPVSLETIKEYLDLEGVEID